MNKKYIFALVIAVATMSACSSVHKLSSGNIFPLKEQKEVNVVIDFTGTLVNGQPEESHINFFSRGKNEEEMKKWLKEWNEDLRNDAYAELIKNLSIEANNKGFFVGNFPNAEYTINVKVINISPGAHLMKNSNVKTNVSFVKKGENTPFATVEYKKTIGKFSNYVPSQITRTAMAFGSLGNDIGKTISKNLK